ncbi:hypothetical protein, variant [Aphanomyces invadans]|uniref:SEC7 domain-containing protein n=1 Tax=Aphanomyces invadans TaxID=157072 RepID=A0A024UJB9_9STRA|nr:hypothetical protein, variant [Aphanomyces invadans]ETW06290.1 hypothetical protein, variant [Aphanomyces invadans]|eukprot:XP_008864365.1 hypothetical protein, variant [Aphanomyces invadans]
MKFKQALLVQGHACRNFGTLVGRLPSPPPATCDRATDSIAACGAMAVGNKTSNINHALWVEDQDAKKVMQQHAPPAFGAMSSPQFIHQGYLHKRNVFGWRKHYCILRGRNMELYRTKSAADDSPKCTTPHRVLLIQHVHTDYRVADQFDVVLHLGRKKTFKLDPEQIQRGEKAQWIQALQTALLCDNALERYGEDITKQLITYASKQVSEYGSLRLDDSMWKTLRKRSIHGDLWLRFLALVSKGIEVTEVAVPPAVGLRYLLCMDMDPAVPREIRLVPMLAAGDEDAGNNENAGISDDDLDAVEAVRRIDLNNMVSVADCSTGSAADAAVRLRRFTLTHVVDDDLVVETFEATSTDLRSRVVFGLAHILKSFHAAKQQHSPRQLRLRRLSTAGEHVQAPSTMPTRQERGSSSQSSVDVLGACSHRVDAAIRSFNVKPKSGISTAADLGVIDDDSPSATAAFLRHTKGLDKDKIGEYLGGDDAFSISVLSAYAMSFPWEGKPFEVCLRDFLSKFRLPGESQKIDRTMEAFARAFHAKNPHMFQHHDAAHILAFSTIMLNTDLHNKSMNNRHRMTKAQFVRNNRGIDKNKSDIPPAILESIYDSIKVHPSVASIDSLTPL